MLQSNNNILYFFILGFIFLLPNITLAEKQKNKFWINTNKQKSFSISDAKNKYLNNTIGFQSKKTYNNIGSNISISQHNNKLIFDQSSIKFNNKNISIGFGKIDRNWSFSPNTSLILSTNARTSDSFFFHIDNDQASENYYLSFLGPWSLEVFNSSLSTTTKIKNPMLLGMRGVFEPVKDLKFEIVKTSQWGGDGKPKDFSSFIAAMAANTNEDKHSHINQIAGYGISYKINKKNISSRIYTQLIGEDEAGSFPSCFIYLIGNELEIPRNSVFSKFGFEYIDTRVDTSTNNYCGPNTAYNNGIYSYTNYGKTLGAPIDTESKSIGVWAEAFILKKLHVNFSINKLIINNENWSNHRLDQRRKDGWLAGIKTSWRLNTINISGGMYYQDFSLKKNKYNEGLSFNLNTEYNF